MPYGVSKWCSRSMGPEQARGAIKKPVGDQAMGESAVKNRRRRGLTHDVEGEVNKLAKEGGGAGWSSAHLNRN